MEIPSSLMAAIERLQVVPAIPAGRIPVYDDHEDTEVVSVNEGADDHLGDIGLSFYLSYDGGSISERRVTLKKIVAERSKVLRFLAICHERRALREFRFDRVREVIDFATGEVLDCRQFEDFILDRLENLPEVRLSAMLRILVFMARCDGIAHPAEWDAIDMVIVRLARALLNDDRGAEMMMADARRLSPDAEDFGRALRYLTKNRLPAKVHQELRRGIGEIIDADGRHHAHEIRWALDAADFIEKMPVSD